jgi:hypothetical protein
VQTSCQYYLRPVVLRLLGALSSERLCPHCSGPGIHSSAWSISIFQDRAVKRQCFHPFPLGPWLAPHDFSAAVVIFSLRKVNWFVTT